MSKITNSYINAEVSIKTKANYYKTYLEIYKVFLYAVAIEDIAYFEVYNLIQEYITLLTYFDSHKNKSRHLFFKF